MTDTDTENTFSQVSLLLMEILHKLGVNKKIRRRRRHTWKQVEQLRSFININLRDVKESHMYIMVYGSQIEASTTPGLQSDIDIVHFNTHIVAIRNIQQCFPEKSNLLMVSDEHTFPGYFKLQIFKEIQDRDMELYSICDCKRRYILKTSPYIASMKGNIHGPAATQIIGSTKIDKIFGITVCNWIHEAKPWQLRHRTCNLISPNEFECLLKKKAFLVPVGHTLSDDRDLEWRISFTSVERKIMSRLNKTQMACYVLIKIIKKCCITPTIGDCLSSYHCKTALLYLIDNTSENLWKSNKLLICLKLLLKTICVWIKEGYCPNYFISQENMFLGKMTGLVRRQLNHILDSLIDMEFKYLLLIQCDQLGQALYNACSRLYTLQETPSDIRHLVTVTQDKTSVFRIDSIVVHEVINVVELGYKQLLLLSGQNVSQALMYTLIQGFQNGSRHLKDVLSILLAFISSHIGCQLASSSIESQTVLPQDMDRAYRFLLFGMSSDVTSGKLKLAGFLLKLGYPALAEVVLDDVEQNLNHYVSDISIIFRLIDQNLPVGFLKETTREKILSEDLPTDNIFKTCIATSVTYLPSELYTILPPLYYEMFRSIVADPANGNPERPYWYNWAVVDARPYLYFLQHQTYTSLGKEGKRQVALNNLVWSVVSDERTTLRETGLNLLAYCLRQERKLELSLLVLYKSLQIKPKDNAAVWQICDFFKGNW